MAINLKKIFCSILLGLGLASLNGHAMVTSSSTTTASSSQQAVQDLPELFNINESIYYQQTPDMHPAVAGLFEEINNIFRAIEIELNSLFPGYTQQCIEILDKIASHDTLKQLIARKIGRDVRFVYYYLFRAVAINIKNTPSKREQYEKIEHFSGLWNRSTKSSLVDIAILEDTLISIIYEIRNSIAQMISHQLKSPDCFIPLFTDTTKEMIQRFDANFPHHKRILLTQKQRKIYQNSFGLSHPDNICKDPKKRQSSIQQATKLALSTDPNVKAIGYQALYCIHQVSLTSDIQKIVSILQCVYELFIKQEFEADLLKEETDINKLIRQHTISHLVQFVLDKSFRSLSFNLAPLFYLAEEMVNTYSAITITKASTQHAFVKNIQTSIELKHREYKLANMITQFLDSFESEGLAYDKPFVQEGIKPSLNYGFIEQPQNSTFFFQQSGRHISPLTRDQILDIERDHNDWRDECSIGQLITFSDNAPSIIDYIVNKFFSPQHPSASKTAKQKKKKNKRKKRKANPVPPSQQLSEQQSRPAESQQETSSVHHQSSTTVHGTALSQVHYAPRIRRWFNKKFAQQYSADSVLYHTFAPCIDLFLLTEGKLGSWHHTQSDHPHHKFSLPGKIVHADGKEYYVIFSCTLDDHNCCYHRGYRYATQDEIEATFAVSLDIPTQQTTAQYHWHVSGFQELQAKTTIDENKNVVNIYDSLNKVKITLFKLPRSQR